MRQMRGVIRGETLKREAKQRHEREGGGTQRYRDEVDRGKRTRRKGSERNRQGERRGEIREKQWHGGRAEVEKRRGED